MNETVIVERRNQRSGTCGPCAMPISAVLFFFLLSQLFLLTISGLIFDRLSRALPALLKAPARKPRARLGLKSSLPSLHPSSFTVFSYA